MRDSSLTSTTGIDVERESISARLLACAGARCWTTTKLKPVSLGNAASNWRKASRPPADAPMPTTQNDGPRSSASGDLRVVAAAETLEVRFAIFFRKRGFEGFLFCAKVRDQASCSSRSRCRIRSIEILRSAQRCLTLLLLGIRRRRIWRHDVDRRFYDDCAGGSFGIGGMLRRLLRSPEFSGHRRYRCPVRFLLGFRVPGL